MSFDSLCPSLIFPWACYTSFHGKTEDSQAYSSVFPVVVFFLISPKRHTVTCVYSPFLKGALYRYEPAACWEIQTESCGKAVECLSCSNKASIAQQEKERKRTSETRTLALRVDISENILFVIISTHSSITENKWWSSIWHTTFDLLIVRLVLETDVFLVATIEQCVSFNYIISICAAPN